MLLACVCVCVRGGYGIVGMDEEKENEEITSEKGLLNAVGQPITGKNKLTLQ